MKILDKDIEVHKSVDQIREELEKIKAELEALRKHFINLPKV